jgi:nifR3 family TIM-barrel protein
LQLYGVDPHYVGEAVKRLINEGRVDHIDMNFGCPVRKVTSKGGGSAIPAKPRLLEAIVGAAVKAAGAVPVTIQFRMGIDESCITYRDAGRVGEQTGCRWVGLHARTAAQLYDGEARWDAIADLKSRLSIPVLGNGDIWEAEDALRMMRHTRCDGVIVGRGCLGRPWLFRDLSDVFAGREPQNPPTLGEVRDVLLEHARGLAAWFGERPALRAFRRHATWYTKCFRNTAELRARLMQITTLAELELTLAGLNGAEPFPPLAMRVPRGKASGTQTVSLPHGYLQNREDATPPRRTPRTRFPAAKPLFLSGQLTSMGLRFWPDAGNRAPQAASMALGALRGLRARLALVHHLRARGHSRSHRSRRSGGHQ